MFAFLKKQKKQKNFLNGFLHKLKAIIFLFGGKIMKYLNTRKRNKILGLFTKVLLSLQIFAVFCFLLGKTEAIFLNSGRICDGDILLLIIDGGVFVVCF